MKVVTSAKYQDPSFENDLVKLTPIAGTSPEYCTECKYVNRKMNRVWILNGKNQTRVEVTAHNKQSKLTERS